MADPMRAGEILVRMVRRHDLPMHLILGAGAVQLAQNYSRSQLAEADAWAQVSGSADFDQEYPAEFPPTGQLRHELSRQVGASAPEQAYR